ncbi:MAG TPA: hypothetical protein VHN14_09020 [Kofleriaceae bacterium]|nr:hypothetical protein [Kofleriaceae bacterium]
MRIKPNGDLINSSDPMYSVELTHPDAPRPGMPQESIAFKYDAQGQPVPKGPGDIQNPYPEGTAAHQAYQDALIKAGHLHAPPSPPPSSSGTDMHASDGETLILRPEGFTLDVVAARTFLESLPGTYRHSAQSPWTLVAPASELPRLRAEPITTSTRPGQPNFVLVWLAPDEVTVHPGFTPSTFGRAQRVISWLLGLGPWRVTGRAIDQERELGIIHSSSELFRNLHSDPDVPENSTESPPRTGELTTFRRYLGDPDTKDYYHEFVRVHDSGAFSYEEQTEQDKRQWEGRLSPDLAARWRSLVAALDFQRVPSDPGVVYDDRVAVIVERPGVRREKQIDAAHPPDSLAELVRLMDGWAEALRAGKIPAELTGVRQVV